MLPYSSFIDEHEITWINSATYIDSSGDLRNINEDPTPTATDMDLTSTGTYVVDPTSTDIDMDLTSTGTYVDPTSAGTYTNSAGVYTGPTSGHIYMGPGTIYVDTTSSPFGTDPVRTPGHPMFNNGLPWGRLYGNLDDAYGRNLPGGRPFLRGQYALDLVRAAERAARVTGSGQNYSAPTNPAYFVSDQNYSALNNPAYPVGVATASDDMLEDSEVVPSTEDQGVTYESTDHDVSDLDIANSPAHSNVRQVSDLDIANSPADSNVQGMSSPDSSRRARPTPRVSSSGGVTKLNKDGRPRKMRSARGPLCKWNEEDILKKALIGLVIAANEDGVQLDYAKAAKYIGVTGPAFQQALLKMHKKLTAEGVDLPKITMEWKPKPRSLVVVLKGRFDLE